MISSKIKNWYIKNETDIGPHKNYLVKCQQCPSDLDVKVKLGDKLCENGHRNIAYRHYHLSNIFFNIQNTILLILSTYIVFSFLVLHEQIKPYIYVPILLTALPFSILAIIYKKMSLKNFYKDFIHIVCSSIARIAMATFFIISMSLMIFVFSSLYLNKVMLPEMQNILFISAIFFALTMLVLFYKRRVEDTIRAICTAFREVISMVRR